VLIAVNQAYLKRSALVCVRVVPNLTRIALCMEALQVLATSTDDAVLCHALARLFPLQFAELASSVASETPPLLAVSATSPEFGFAALHPNLNRFCC
jgi:hypothetical protein